MLYNSLCSAKNIFIRYIPLAQIVIVRAPAQIVIVSAPHRHPRARILGEMPFVLKQQIRANICLLSVRRVITLANYNKMKLDVFNFWTFPVCVSRGFLWCF